MAVLSPWAIGVGVAGYLGLAVTGGLYLGARDRITELGGKLATQAAQTIECTEANQSNQDALARLTEANRRLVDERRASEALREQELEKRSQELSQARLQADKLRRERDAIIQGSAECRAHSVAVLADSCPDLAERLRQRSRGPGGDPN